MDTTEKIQKKDIAYDDVLYQSHILRKINSDQCRCRHCLILDKKNIPRQIMESSLDPNSFTVTKINIDKYSIEKTDKKNSSINPYEKLKYNASNNTNIVTPDVIPDLPIKQERLPIENSLLLPLSGESSHPKEFNEMVRRIKTREQHEIMQQMKDVTKSKIQQLKECCMDPKNIFTMHKQFFTSPELPVIALKAFREMEISVDEFSTIAELFAIYEEEVIRDPEFKIEHISLFDLEGKPNRIAWGIIGETITNSAKSKFIRGDKFTLDYQGVPTGMISSMTKASPIESGIWIYPKPKMTQCTPSIADRLELSFNVHVLYRTSDKELMPTMTLRRAFVNSVYGIEAIKINPVIGISKFSDIVRGATKLHRDLTIPFLGQDFPDNADTHPVYAKSNFIFHDFAHGMRGCAVNNKDATVFFAFGKSLHEQLQRYRFAVLTIQQNFAANMQLLPKFYEKLNELNKEKIALGRIKLGGQCLQLYRIIKNLKMDISILNQMSIMLYDLDLVSGHYMLPTSTERERKNYYLKNIINLFEGLQHKKRKNIIYSRWGTGFAYITGKVVLKTMNEQGFNLNESQWCNYMNLYNRYATSLKNNQEKLTDPDEILKNKALIQNTGSMVAFSYGLRPLPT